MKVQNSIIIVFKTSVTEERLSEEIREEIMFCFPVIACNFDLEDCDHILRIESESLFAQKIIDYLNEKGLSCEELV